MSGCSSQDLGRPIGYRSGVWPATGGLKLELSWPLEVALLASGLGSVFLLRLAIAQMCSECGHGRSAHGVDGQICESLLGDWIVCGCERFTSASATGGLIGNGGGRWRTFVTTPKLYPELRSSLLRQITKAAAGAGFPRRRNCWTSTSPVVAEVHALSPPTTVACTFRLRRERRRGRLTIDSRRATAESNCTEQDDGSDTACH